MANITDLMGSFFSTEIPELQALFKEQTSEWLIQFFTALNKNPKVTKKWAERIFKVLPPDTCFHTTYLFCKKIGINNPLKKKNCPVEKDMEKLREALEFNSLEDIHLLMERIPHDHFPKYTEGVFTEIFANGDIKLIAKLLDIYLAKIGLESLQKYLEQNKGLPMFLYDESGSKGIRQLIDLYHKKGISPVYFIELCILFFTDIQTFEICLPELPSDQKIPFVKENARDLLLRSFSYEIELEKVLETFEKHGIPRSEFFLDLDKLIAGTPVEFQSYLL